MRPEKRMKSQIFVRCEPWHLETLHKIAGGKGNSAWIRARIEKAAKRAGIRRPDEA